MLKCSNVQIFKWSSVPMFQCSDVQMFKCSNVEAAAGVGPTPASSAPPSTSTSTSTSTSSKVPLRCAAGSTGRAQRWEGGSYGRLRASDTRRQRVVGTLAHSSQSCPLACICQEGGWNASLLCCLAACMRKHNFCSLVFFFAASLPLSFLYSTPWTWGTCWDLWWA